MYSNYFLNTSSGIDEFMDECVERMNKDIDAFNARVDLMDDEDLFD